MKFFDILGSQKLLAGLLLLSVLVIIAGLLLIKYSESQATQNTQTQDTVATMQRMATEAATNLDATRSQQHAGPMSDVKPDIYAERVAALNGAIPDKGSEDWCAVMMVKDADEWTEAEQQLFAKHCL
jgi:hypothetical protein